MIFEQLKINLWTLVYGPYYKIKYWRTHSERKKLDIMRSLETIRYIIENGCSVSRFGDGELQMMRHYDEGLSDDSFKVDTFQKYDSVLAERLCEVFATNIDNLLVCLPYALKDASVSKGFFWERQWLTKCDTIKSHHSNRLLGDSSFTRFYMGRKDINDYPAYIKSLKEIWNNRDVVIVEGKLSRLGVGNNLFNNARSIQRILCPSTDAFSSYDAIYSETIKQNKEKLILIALGHTATVLAYDLSRDGFQAIDIGHVDIEYEWYLMKANKKEPIKYKYVNEVKKGRIIDDLMVDAEYQSQIISIID